MGHNVELTYKRAMSYDEWLAEEKRWMLSEKTDVRKIDSVYRTRDMGRARRGEIISITPAEARSLFEKARQQGIFPDTKF